ncbi:MAG: EamA family transporter RarD [Chloroflexota bacterium]|nr:EamA family transporter RarD [Chloroflexota bacterium]
MSEPERHDNSARTESERGVLFGVAAYSMWGVFPLYFNALAPSSAVEILVNRVVWSTLFCAIVWIVLRDISWVRPLIAVPRRLFLLVIAAFVLAINWGGYIYAVTVENVVETSLGYFINPLVLVLMGVLILHERLRPMQWMAVGIGALAVLVIAFDYGRPPWIALTLAFSFAIYGFIKKHVGADIGALASMTTETVVLAPLALIALVWIEASGRGTFSHDAPWHALLLLASGVITAGPLICFAAAARRVPLTTMGLLQFLAPVLQLICGVVILGEDVPPVRWVGFGLVWVALSLLTIDSWKTARRRSRRLASRPAMSPGS